MKRKNVRAKGMKVTVKPVKGVMIKAKPMKGRGGGKGMFGRVGMEP